LSSLRFVGDIAPALMPAVVYTRATGGDDAEDAEETA
jgi:hypothetical protein